MTLQGLRSSDTLNARVDNLLMQQEAAASLNTDVVSFSLGGKLVKSPRDSVIRKIRVLTLWPHQFVHRSRLAEVKYDTLSMQDFVAGTCAILTLHEISNWERDIRTQLLGTMLLARTFTWSSVHGLYAAFLEDVQYGVCRWDDSAAALAELKDELLTPAHLISTTGTRGGGGEANPNQKTELCRQYNYSGTGCPRSICRYQHACIICYGAQAGIQLHKAQDCNVTLNATSSASKKIVSILPPSITPPSEPKDPPFLTTTDYVALYCSVIAFQRQNFCGVRITVPSNLNIRMNEFCVTSVMRI